MNIIKSLVRFGQNEEGPTAVEYAVIVMLIFLAVIATVQVLGGTTRDSFGDSSSKIDSAMGGS